MAGCKTAVTGEVPPSLVGTGDADALAVLARKVLVTDTGLKDVCFLTELPRKCAFD